MTELIEVNKEIVDKNVYRDYSKKSKAAYWLGVYDFQELLANIRKNSLKMKVISRDDGVKLLIDSMLGSGSLMGGNKNIINDQSVKAEESCSKCNCSVF